MTDARQEKEASGSHLGEETLLDLTFGLLPMAEAACALDHLADCAPCEERLRRRSGEIVRLRASRWIRYGSAGEIVLEDRPESEASAMARDEATVRQIAVWWDRIGATFRRPVIGAAVGLAAAAVLLLLVLPRDHDQGEWIAQLRELPSVSEEVRLRAADERFTSRALADGLEAYDRGDARSAIGLLEQAEVSGHWETIRRLYLGSALAQRGEFAKAADVLGSIEADAAPDPWWNEARWSLYISYRGLGRESQADSLLRLLGREPGEIGERARRELGQRSGPEGS